MGSNKPAKTVQICGNAFAITGERRPEGILRFSVLDIDCVLPEDEDVIALQFQDGLKRRLEALRREREPQTATAPAKGWNSRP